MIRLTDLENVKPRGSIRGIARDFDRDAPKSFPHREHRPQMRRIGGKMNGYHLNSIGFRPNSAMQIWENLR